MATTKWTALGSTTTLLSTELNSLANVTLSTVGGEVDNATDKNMFADIQLDVTFAGAPSTGASCQIFAVPALDGTNYATSHQDYTPHLLGGWPLRAVTTQQIITIRNALLPPTKWKPALYNNSGQAFPASGSTVKYRTYNTETA